MTFSNGKTDDCMVHGRKERKIITARQMSGSNFLFYIKHNKAKLLI